MPELLLLSGGIDSIALAAWRRPAVCLTVDYGQLPAGAEMRAAAQACRDLQLHHEVLSAAIPTLGTGDLAGKDPSMHSSHSEFWPFRNQYLITLGAMAAIKYRCDAVLIGTVNNDRRHRDGSLEFLAAMDAILTVQEGSIRLLAPAASLSSEELVRRSGIAHSTLAWSHSCHIGNLACGQCRGCQKHYDVTAALGWPG